MTLLENMSEFRRELAKHKKEINDKLLDLFKSPKETQKKELNAYFKYLKRKERDFHSYYQDFYTVKESNKTPQRLTKVFVDIILLLNELSLKLRKEWTTYDLGEMPSNLEEEYTFRKEIYYKMKEDLSLYRRMMGKTHVLPMYKEEEKPRDLFVIQAHSKDEKKMCKIPEGIHLFHYCKSGCTLTSTIVYNKISDNVRSLSRELACLGEIDIQDHFKNTAPYYSFEADHSRHGIFKCETTRQGHQMIRIDSINTRMNLLEVLLRIQSYRVSKNSLDTEFDLGIVGCRGTSGCNQNKMIVDPPSHYLNREHTRLHHRDQWHKPGEHPELFRELLNELDRMTNLPISKYMKRYSIRSEKMPAGVSARASAYAIASAKEPAKTTNSANAAKTANAPANAHANAPANKKSNSVKSKNSSNVRRTPYPNVHDLNLTPYLRSKKGKTMKNRIGSINPFRRSKVSN